MKYMGASKNSEFAQMQGAEKISPRCIWLYVSKKFFTQRSSWDEMWIFRGSHLLMVPLLLAASLASGAEFSVLRPQQSSIVFVSKQMGVPVEGSFRKFTARIAVDPAKPETGSASVDIDLASIDTGNTEANEEVAGKAWFDTKNHPVASFISGSVKPSGKERYEALGKLSIKGKSLDIKALFTLKQNADTLVIDGAFPIKRLDYGIGLGIWSDTDTVADEVQIRFHFTIAKK